MASSLPEELLQEIFLRLPPGELVDLVRASLVCKAWRRVLSDRNCFLRRCRGFHGAPPLLGYIHHCDDGSPMRFVTMTTSITSPVPVPSCPYYVYGWLALDCRHGRVLLLDRSSRTCLMVWDPITGTEEHIRVPCCDLPATHPSNCYAGAVLCAKDGCDHLDCHGGPFHVVIVQTGRIIGSASPCVSKYSSLTDEWSAPTIGRIISLDSDFSYNQKQNLLIGDALYFPIRDGSGILKYDLCTHWLSRIGMPHTLSMAILMETEDGGLGVVTLSDNCVHMWSWQDVTNEIGGGWVEDRVMEIGKLLPRCVPYKVVAFAEGTNTIFVNISTRILTLDLKTKEVRKVHESKVNVYDTILPYMSFYTPRSSKGQNVTTMKVQ